MINGKRLLISGVFLLIVFFTVLQINNVSAVGEISYCCEKTTSGAWCQDVDDVAKCDTFRDFRSVPTSCEATSYCKLGTCVNSQEGTCMENTPQRSCEEPVGGVAQGIWFDARPSEIPQCQLGCCLIGEQAAFTTQTRCKQLSSLYGLETDYRTDIQSEIQCIASATPEVKGACVFEEDFQRTCRFTTKEDCQDIEASGVLNVEFNQGFLCSNEELGTNCGASKKTTLAENRDEVFFIDTCGNLANIYDSTKVNDRIYWDEIVPKAASCGFGDVGGNAEDPSCGNCDYLDGSTGKLYDRFLDGASARPNFGDYVCRDLGCEFEADLNNDGDATDDGEFGPFRHGETWCANSAGTSEIIVDVDGITDREVDLKKENTPGSRYFRMVCYNGEVTVEPCADFRQEICIESAIETDEGPFRNAACRVNAWEDCVVQTDKDDCENIDRRDCRWAADSSGRGKCVPKYSPGINFWEAGEAETLCLQASETCEVVLERGLSGSLEVAGDIAKGVGGAGSEWVCAEKCKCLGLKQGDKLTNERLNSWAESNNKNICPAVGDCGVSENYVGEEGENKIGDLYDESRKKDSG